MSDASVTTTGAAPIEAPDAPLLNQRRQETFFDQLLRAVLQQQAGQGGNE